MRVKLFVLAVAAALVGPLAAHAGTVGAPSTPTSAQDRSVDPVVLAGNQFPTWSAGPELVAQATAHSANESHAFE